MSGKVVRALAVLPLIVMLGAGMVSCSDGGEGRSYTIPESLCGVAIPSSALSSFLPGGSEVSVKDAKPVLGENGCEVFVDGKLVLATSREWWRKSDSISSVVFLHHQLKNGKLMDEEGYLYTATGALGKVRNCTDPRFPDEVMYTTIGAQGDVDGDAQAMKKLITAYTKGVEKSSECS
jgi:hypothetical protein